MRIRFVTPTETLHEEDVPDDHVWELREQALAHRLTHTAQALSKAELADGVVEIPAHEAAALYKLLTRWLGLKPADATPLALK